MNGGRFNELLYDRLTFPIILHAICAGDNSSTLLYYNIYVSISADIGYGISI